MTPPTAAGRELLAGPVADTITSAWLAERIRAIEDESWNAALAAVEEAVGGLHDGTGKIERDIGFPGLPYDPAVLMRNAVLAAITSLRKPVTP